MAIVPVIVNILYVHAKKIKEFYYAPIVRFVYNTVSFVYFNILIFKLSAYMTAMIQ